MKNFWLDRNNKKQKDLKKRIQEINKLLIEYGYKESVFLVDNNKKGT